jgi:hypothetical protein
MGVHLRVTVHIMGYGRTILWGFDCVLLCMRQVMESMNSYCVFRCSWRHVTVFLRLCMLYS